MSELTGQNPDAATRGQNRASRSELTGQNPDAATRGQNRASRSGSSRLAVRKTYKLFIGGAFPRSESGRTYVVNDNNVALASRKDLRDAVVAARKAFPGWSGATAYNRGQVVYRIAEMAEARRKESSRWACRPTR